VIQVETLQGEGKGSYSLGYSSSYLLGYMEEKE